LVIAFLTGNVPGEVETAPPSGLGLAPLGAANLNALRNGRRRCAPEPMTRPLDTHRCPRTRKTGKLGFTAKKAPRFS
jgi:hypothetical protein